MLQADIAEAKELPVIPPDEVTRMEFNMKDQMIRNTIIDTQKDVQEIKQSLEKIEDTIEKASVPETLITAIAPIPLAVESAQIVSFESKIMKQN